MLLAMSRYNHRVRNADEVLAGPALVDAIGTDSGVSDLPPHSSEAVRQPWVQMQIDDEPDVWKDAFTYVRASVGHRCHHDHACPGLFAPLPSEDSASQQLGLAVATRTWCLIALAGSTLQPINCETVAPRCFNEFNAGA